MTDLPDDHDSQEPAPEEVEPPLDGVKPPVDEEEPVLERVEEQPYEPPSSETHGEFKDLEPLRPGPGMGGALLWSLGFIAFQLIFGVILALIIVITRGMGEEVMAEMMPFLFNAIAVGNMLFVTAAVLVVYRHGIVRFLSFRGLHPAHILLIILIVLPLNIVMNEIGNLCAEIFPVSDTLEMIKKYAQGPWIMLFFFGCLLPGVSEELFFRGIIGRGVVARRGIVVGVVWVSFLFGAVHLDPIQSIAVIPLGIVCHMTYLGSRSMLAPILLHTLNNTLAFFMAKAFLEESLIQGLNEIPGDTLIHIPAHIILPALVALIALCILYSRARVRWVTQDGQEWTPGYPSAEMPPEEIQARPRLSSPGLAAVVIALVAFAALLAGIAFEIHVTGSTP